MKFINTLFLTLISACSSAPHLTSTTPPPSPPGETLHTPRELERESDRLIYDSYRFEDSFTDTPENTLAFDATYYVLNEDGDMIGAGTLIGSDVILTAAHVACRALGGYVQLTKEDMYIPIINVWVHPDYLRWGSEDTDIALLKLDCEVADVEPLSLAHPCTSLTRYKSSIFTVGCSLRYKKQSLPQVMVFYGKIVSALNELKIRSTSTTIWFGDSGGPVVLKVPDNPPVVIGVIARFSMFQGRIMDGTAMDVRVFAPQLQEIMASWNDTHE